MRDDIFAGVFEEPFSAQEVWIPLLAENDNAPLGVDMPSFAAHRRISAAVMLFTIRRRRAPKPAVAESPAGIEDIVNGDRKTPLDRAKHWFLSDPA